jgi:putative ABC transport system permease protein
VVRPLDRKLLRDLWRLRSQVATIALVVASGIGGFLGSLSAHDSLVRLRDNYYETGRFAHVFVIAKRAPQRLEPALREISGVVDVQTAIAGSVIIVLPGVTDLVSGRVMSLPERGPPQMNRLYLRAGRWPAPGDQAGVLVSDAFAKARGLRPGDPLMVLINGKYERLQVRGIALSPEYIFAMSAGAFSDDTRFGVLWLGQRRLEAAYDMVGAFNYAALRLARGASEAHVIAAVDRLLMPYGSTGAYGRSEQTSHRALSSEIDQQQVFGTVLPAVFLAVAVFLLNVLLHRHIATERSQVASLKALGYADLTIGAHFLKFALVIVLLGIAGGLAVGLLFGRWMTNLYTLYFHFPSSDYRLGAGLVAIGAAIALLGGIAAVASGIRGIVRLTPAEAMRPPAPTRYRRTLADRLGLARLSAAARMVVRELEQRPWRTVLTTLGMACAVAIIVAGTWWGDAFDWLINLEFGVRERPDSMLVLAEPAPVGSLHEVAQLPGVLLVEGTRDVPVILRNGIHELRASIVGVDPGAKLRQVLDAGNRPTAPPPGGLMLGAPLADRLGARPGDYIWVEPLQGLRSPRLLRVSALSSDLVGSVAYMRRLDAARMVGEGDTVSTIRVRLDRGRYGAFTERVRAMPRIAAVGDRTLMLRSFRRTQARNLLYFTGILSVFAAAIAVGVVYNSARIALAEHAWELATLRVLGFTRAEVSRILLSQSLVQLLVAIPLGCLLGYWLSGFILSLMPTHEFRIPLVIRPSTYAYAAVVTVVAGLVSALVVRRRIDRLDLVGVLKTRD